MKKFTCPYCYELHSIKDCIMKCSYNVAGKNCVSTVIKSSNGNIPDSAKKKCFKCQAARRVVYCPHYTTKEIPQAFWRGPSFSVALVGAKSSGKSNYIGVIINEIRMKMTSKFNCCLSITASEESKQVYDDFYYNPLFKDGYVVNATSVGEIPPLIFPLEFMNKRNKVRKVAALTFYDTAGENLEKKEQMDNYNQYITNANGIIMLIDPLQIDCIRERLPREIVDANPKNVDPGEVLSRILDRITNITNTSTIKTPLALVFTKSDIFKQYGLLKEDSPLFEESQHLQRGVFDLSDFENVNKEIENLVENWLGGDLLQQIKRFEHHAMFGVSSFGANPIGTKLSEKIHPIRVLDPLLWLLAGDKFIKTFKYKSSM